MLLFAVVAALRAYCAGGTPLGQVVGWGDNTSGEATGVPFFGWTLPAAYTNTPLATGVVFIASQPLTAAVAVAAGNGHGLALRTDGTVAGWGENNLCQATGVETPFPGRTNGLVVINGKPLSGVTAIAACWFYSMALRGNGTVVAWGALDTGKKMAVPAGLSNVVAVAVGYNHALALKSDGTVAAWGRTKMPPIWLSNVVAMAAGRREWSHDLALRKDGTVAQWSLRGEGDEIPVVPGLSNIVAIAAG